MRKIVFVILALVVLCCNVMAAPVEIISTEPVPDMDSYYSVSSVVSDDIGGGSGDLGELVGVQLMSLSPIGPEDTSGLKSVLLDLLGDYDPVIVEYEYQNNNQYSSYLREVQPDYVWLCSAGLLGLVVYCIFRLGGALLRD